MKILYFAWMRQRIGTSSEEIDLPANVATVDELIDWLI
ncbi:MAG: molybdopterin synthase sulfur carrier subunit, partial [Alphaproteobacteria bacterium]